MKYMIYFLLFLVAFLMGIILLQKKKLL
jgi:preprotein translocase subunit SecG